MDGVTVLNEFEITTQSVNYSAIAFAVTILATTFFGAIFGFIIKKKNLGNLGLGPGALIGLLVGLFFGMLASIKFASIHTETKARYEVYINDNVSMNEFLEHYRIIEQRGDIYVVEENNPQ